MRRALRLGAAALAAGAGSAAGQSSGPDLITGDVTDLRYWATVGGTNAYSVGASGCNVGDAPVSWDGTSNLHPIVAQNIYRIKNNRFVHIGQGWVKHGHSAANASGCATCILPPNGTSQLGVGCSDTYAAGLNGFQILLGPRSQINATTGDFPYPYSTPPINTALDRRVQVAVSDVSASNNPNALYFAEATWITADDALAGNGLNNVSYRQIMFNDTASDPVVVGDTQQQMPAIVAWQSFDPTVILTVAEYTDTTTGTPITARFWIGARSADNGDGTWHYEYAIFNQNADRCAGSFSVPISGQVTITNFGFHAPLSHSGEPYSNDLWDAAATADSVIFATTPYDTDPNANAIRWGTLYNVRFDASTPPTTGTGTLGLFKPGDPDSLFVAGIPVPSSGDTPPCYPNCDGSTDAPVLNILDFACFLTRFSQGDPWANCDGSTTPPVLNILDFNCFLRQFAAGCP
jgi:hypothetical protein